MQEIEFLVLHISIICVIGCITRELGNRMLNSLGLGRDNRLLHKRKRSKKNTVRVLFSLKSSSLFLFQFPLLIIRRQPKIELQLITQVIIEILLISLVEDYVRCCRNSFGAS